ncbi:C-14 sterol reductase [Aspergillus terreus]|uniref:C-14 sterol reductase n=1 Tax=Aspergillus terreus TaxID=33178 RepID=A0A5M3YYU1_ASPTE|nr:hypothetical protein ATETN484_0006030600 [Aspergillus terreus]GFF20046.1 C-14 sterol reductase [Aspergillus terreus]
MGTASRGHCPKETYVGNSTANVSRATSALPNHLQDERFRFTPVKSNRPAPRVWERKPSTAYMGRAKSRKVWKRFRSSFNSMKQLQQLILAEQEGVDEGLSTEINTSRSAGLLRGVKRQCFGLEDARSADVVDTRRRSFLETKWESQTMGRRRKLPAMYRNLVAASEPMDVEDSPLTDNDTAPETTTSDAHVVQKFEEDDESPRLTPDTPVKMASESAYPRALHGPVSGMTAGASSIKPPTDNGKSEFTFDFVGSGPSEFATITGAEADDQGVDAGLDQSETEDRRCDLIQQAGATAAPVQALTAEQESTLVRSALRSSLDGEDAALLNDFLSKAKAKREAKAAAALIAEVTADANDSRPEEELEVPEMPTPQPRRALEDLDANSPSPQKAQLSPSKASDKKPPPDDEAPSSPHATASPRRSTRNRHAKLPAASTAAKAVRNTFSLRRAKGTEFVFLQRTEAQELALTTRRNTRQNKGDAQLPKYALVNMATRTPPADEKPKRQRSKGAKKQVSWNEERLVQFEGEDEDRDGGEAPASDVVSRRGASRTAKGGAADKRKAASSRTTRSQGSPPTGDEGVEAAATTAAATATPRARRVRRLGTSAATPAAESASTSSSPTGKRKKLMPKSPKASLTGVGTPVSKKTGSHIPIHGKSSSLGSSSAKSTSLMKAHAGSTPMPRRVRPRS